MARRPSVSRGRPSTSSTGSASYLGRAQSKSTSQAAHNRYKPLVIQDYKPPSRRLDRQNSKLDATATQSATMHQRDRDLTVHDRRASHEHSSRLPPSHAHSTNRTFDEEQPHDSRRRRHDERHRSDAFNSVETSRPPTSRTHRERESRSTPRSLRPGRSSKANEPYPPQSTYQDRRSRPRILQPTQPRARPNDLVDHDRSKPAHDIPSILKPSQKSTYATQSDRRLKPPRPAERQQLFDSRKSPRESRRSKTPEKHVHFA